MRFIACCALLVAFLPSVNADDTEIVLTLRKRTVPELGEKPAYEIAKQKWSSTGTAVIVVDMWDTHHCYNAVQRVVEMAPRMNEVLVKCRDAGMTIIHAPSSCMDAYKDHPGRKRAMDAPKAAN